MIVPMICTNKHFMRYSLLKDRIFLLQPVSNINVSHRSDICCGGISKYLVKSHCAHCLLSCDDYNGALELLGQVLTTMRQILPADHADVAIGKLET